MHDAPRNSRAGALLVALNVGLLAAAVLVVMKTGVIPTNGEQLVEYEKSSFVYSGQPTDIVVGPTVQSDDEVYVLYTNYACPYCATVHAALSAARNDGQSTLPQPNVVRLHFLENDSGRFSTQETVSSYMLRLWREDPAAYASLESELFEHQDEWTSLDESQLLSWLNGRSGRPWEAGDLEPERSELLEAQEESPGDLAEVPSLYSNGKRHSGLVYALV